MSFGIVARVGSDPAVIELGTDYQNELRIGGASDIGDVSLKTLAETLERRGIASGTVAQDLLVLAIAVFAADTRIQRDKGDDGWTRRITLSIPVRDTALWIAARLSLERALRFLTGDLWTLEFRTSTLALGFSDKRDEEKTPSGARVSLFSGGLDSFIGALDLISTHEPLVLVGHYTDGSVSVPQHEAFTHVMRMKGQQQHVDLISTWIVLPRNLFGHGNDERQRSRSLLFIALGVLIGNAVGTTQLVIPENGFISLNVPLTDLRIGSYSTRTTHPHYISLLNQVLEQLGLKIRLHNPYKFKTKGEMLIECAIQTDLLNAGARTMSCAHPTASRWEYKGAPSRQHCGRCTACLIRRAAFLRSFRNDETPYTEQELLAHELRSDSARGADVRAVRLAASRVMDNPDIAEFLILKPGPLQGNYTEYADLYRRGMRELWNLVELAQTRGAY